MDRDGSSILTWHSIRYAAQYNNHNNTKYIYINIKSIKQSWWPCAQAAWNTGVQTTWNICHRGRVAHTSSHKPAKFTLKKIYINVIQCCAHLRFKQLRTERYRNATTSLGYPCNNHKWKEQTGIFGHLRKPDSRLTALAPWWHPGVWAPPAANEAQPSQERTSLAALEINHMISHHMISYHIISYHIISYRSLVRLHSIAFQHIWIDSAPFHTSTTCAPALAVLTIVTPKQL